MKIGIVGGGNCYALNFANYAKAQGHDVFGIGRSPGRSPSMWPVYREYRYYQGHIVTQLPSVLAMLDTERPELIVNFAAQGEGQGSFGSDAHLFYQTNTVALVQMVEALRHRKYLKRFIQIGTSELYGSVTKPSRETDPICPTSPYAISKAAFDLHLDVMGRVHKFPWDVIRPSNAYCPGQQLHRVIPKAIIAALAGRRFPLQGGGKARKTYIHATDLSAAILAILPSEPGQIYNCGTPDPVSIRGVVELCAIATNVNPEDFIEVVGDRVGQDGCYWLDSIKLYYLGWSPRIGLEKGIAGMVQWIRDNPDIMSMSTDWKVRP